MKTALYVGDHRGDTLVVQASWGLTRLGQKGPLGIVTHTEMIHDERTDGGVRIASSSLRDRGVRGKDVMLTPGNWMIVDVPQWSVHQSVEWFAVHDGELYDLRGALATMLPGKGVWNRWFCNQADGASVGLCNPETFSPSQFASIALTLGTDVTAAFFGDRASC